MARLMMNKKLLKPVGHALLMSCLLMPGISLLQAQEEKVSDAELDAVLKLEEARINMVERISPTVVCIFGMNPGGGGGSGVLMLPGGYAVTNFHVTAPVGTKGKAGLNDRVTYDWDLVGMDPGGDLAIIKLKSKDGKEFPIAEIGNSDRVRVGEFAFALGNPFLLAEDYQPTVTMGIISGINRFQEGASKTMLVYGNCIQVDTSINPGNSGGPLFNMPGQVIGINGRVSIEERGRVNVGVGYAISIEQVKNFIPGLMATQITQHGTLNATFTGRRGKVICAEISTNSPIYQAGMRLGDELLEFAWHEITQLNDFTNIVWTLPARWPVKVVWNNANGQRQEAWVRLTPLEYEQQRQRGANVRRATGGRVFDKQGEINDQQMNTEHVVMLLSQVREWQGEAEKAFKTTELIFENGQQLASRDVIHTGDGRYLIKVNEAYGNIPAGTLMGYDGEVSWLKEPGKAAVKNPNLINLDQQSQIKEFFKALQTDNVLSDYKAAQLEGGDLAEGRRAYRIKLTTKGDESFYVWVSLMDESQEVISPRILKTGSNVDGMGRNPNVIYSDYVAVNGWKIPSTLKQVRGIGDHELIREFKRQDISLLDEINDSAFQMPEGE